MSAALQPVLYSYDPEREAVWVDATPFRAHVTQLLGAGLTVSVIAQLAGVRERSVQHLAHGREGRRVQRICRDTGRRLLRITTMEARAVRFRPVPVRLSRERLRTMVGAGWTVDRLADQTELWDRRGCSDRGPGLGHLLAAVRAQGRGRIPAVDRPAGDRSAGGRSQLPGGRVRDHVR